MTTRIKGTNALKEVIKVDKNVKLLEEFIFKKVLETKTNIRKLYIRLLEI